MESKGRYQGSVQRPLGTPGDDLVAPDCERVPLGDHEPHVDRFATLWKYMRSLLPCHRALAIWMAISTRERRRGCRKRLLWSSMRGGFKFSLAGTRLSLI